ncbi:hypothetical protein [Kitasatospora sp. Root107]|nr:hypothetical protein [Kitasatospora sp. Root107]
MSTNLNGDFKVADLSLAAFGRKEIQPTSRLPPSGARRSSSPSTRCPV